MRQLKFLVGRNLAIFMQNKKTVLLSFGAIAIVFGLYALFLRDFIIDMVAKVTLNIDMANKFTDQMMMAGLLVVINTTTCFGIMQLYVSDIQQGIRRDYLVAPIASVKIDLGYLITSWMVSQFFTCFAMLTSQCYFLYRYQEALYGMQLIKVVLFIQVCSIINSLLLLCMVQFMKDTTSFSTFGNLYGMLVGFLAGTYFPYSFYPTALKEVLFFYPPTQMTSILRQLSLQDGNEILFRSYGVSLEYKNTVVQVEQQMVLLIILFCLLLIIMRVTKFVRKYYKQE